MIQIPWPRIKAMTSSRGVGHASSMHQRYLSSQHFYTRVALRNSKTTSWSKVEGVGFHKKARKVAY